MSSPETAPTGERKFVDVITPFEAGHAYCDALTHTYGPENLRIMLQANYYIAPSDEPDFYRHSARPKPKRYEKVPVDYPSSDGVMIDGLFVGATIIEVKNDDFYYSTEVPHAILQDAKLVEFDITLTEYPEEKIMVPMSPVEPYDRITFYR